MQDRHLVMNRRFLKQLEKAMRPVSRPGLAASPHDEGSRDADVLARGFRKRMEEIAVARTGTEIDEDA